MPGPTELERARTELERAERAVNIGTNPYAEEWRNRTSALVAKLEVASAPTIPHIAPTPAAAVPTVRLPIAPQPTGTREDRLTRLAKAIGGNEAQLDRAIAEGTSPDAFSLELTNAMIARRKAAAERAEIEAMVERIIEA